MAACVSHLPPDLDMVWGDDASLELESVIDEYERTVRRVRPSRLPTLSTLYPSLNGDRVALVQSIPPPSFRGCLSVAEVAKAKPKFGWTARREIVAE